MSRLVLGTRGSDLARTQTRMVQAALKAAHPDLECETRIIKTIGDQRQDLKLTEFSQEQIVDKGIFTKELELALASAEIDVAVHSLKDVPTELEARFALSAVLPREDTEDVLLTKRPFRALADLPQNAKLATSSVRRRAQLLWQRPDLEVEEIRGNVPTRLNKLLQNETLEGILLAKAGLLRLGYLPQAEDTAFPWESHHLFLTALAPPDFLPACGQGAIALETRSDDVRTHDTLRPINDADTFLRVSAERLILERLQAGCHTPVGVDTWLTAPDQLGIQLRVFDEEHLTAPPKEARVTGSTMDLTALIDQLMDSLND